MQSAFFEKGRLTFKAGVAMVEPERFAVIRITQNMEDDGE